MSADDPNKRVLLRLPAVPWLPKCDECGAELNDARSKAYVVITKKKGYKVREHKHGRICRMCELTMGEDNRWNYLFAGMDTAVGGDKSSVLLWAYGGVNNGLFNQIAIPAALIGAGGR